ncbi:MAG: DUF4384 domain-containing protein [Geminicoccaceae bacterium]|nr:DUF4384 domain-containing protein [Geminicoccaceae bacterium]
MLLVSAATAARADMVVIATTAPEVTLGERVPDGTRLEVPDGAQVTLISADGSTLTVEAPGGVVGGASSSGGQRSIIDALQRVIQQEENVGGVGATRSASPAACAGVDDVLTLLKKGCEREAAARLKELAGTLSPSLYLGAQRPGSRPAFRLGEPIDITVQTNFDAYVYCFHEGSDGSTTRLVPLAGTAPRMEANKPAKLAGDLGQFGALVASEPSGIDRLACFASESDLAGEAGDILGGSPSLGKGAIDGRIRQAFAGDHDGRSAAGTLELEILQ